MKEIALIALGGAGLFVIYKMFSGSSPVVQAQAIAQANASQPSQSYPYQSPTASIVRQDNQSQPWYGGALNFSKTGNVSSLFSSSDVANLQSVASVTSSAKSIWDDLDMGGWFSSGSDSYALDDYAYNDETNYSVDWSGVDNTSGMTDFSSIA